MEGASLIQGASQRDELRKQSPKRSVKWHRGWDLPHGPALIGHSLALLLENIFSCQAQARSCRRLMR